MKQESLFIQKARARSAFNDTKCQQHVRDYQQLTYTLEDNVITRVLFSHPCPSLDCDYKLEASTSFLFNFDSHQDNSWDSIFNLAIGHS